MTAFALISAGNGKRLDDVIKQQNFTYVYFWEKNPHQQLKIPEVHQDQKRKTHIKWG